MQELLRQLEELFLQAIPTVVILFLFYLFMRSVFFKPILQAIDERHQRIEGAQAETETIRNEIREKNNAYHEAVKRARSEIYAEQESKRKAVLAERTQRVNAARGEAQERVRGAKQEIARELATERGVAEQQSDSLADEIVRGVLQSENGKHEVHR
jgi:F0F1-type ATP synthase membrane subunit b/b'